MSISLSLFLFRRLLIFLAAIEENIDVFGEEDDDKAVIAIVPQSLKRPAVPYLDTIRAYAGECGATDAVPLDKKPRKEDQEDVHAQLERVSYHLRLEQEYRLLESQKNARAQSKSKKENEKLREQLTKNEEEIALLKQQLSSPTRRRKVRAKKSDDAVPITTMVVYGQNDIDVAAAVVRPVKEKTPKQKAQEAEANHELAIRESFTKYKEATIQWYEQYDESTHDVLRVFTEGSMANIGITQPYNYRLAVYLEVFLDATQVGNQHLRDMLNHPFLADYRVKMMPNMYELSDQVAHSAIAMMQQKNDVLNTASLNVRQNLSNVAIHANFIAKAIQFADQATELGYRPVVLDYFQHAYSQEIIDKWYPRLDAGNGCLVTADLKIPAVCIQSGQGRGKRCCFCGLEYIATCGGSLKHTHQVPSCDYLANYSNDEAVVLAVVLQKRATSAKFAKHAFIANYNEHSLLRLATPEEIALGLYVTCGTTNEHLRLNMRVFLAMRQQVYEEFLLRIDSLDTHQDNKNLNAKPIAYQLDCFGYTGAVAKQPKKQQQQQKAKKTKSDTMKIRKEDGFLYKTLMDHQGGQFRVSKFHAETKETLRDFTLNTDTGFGDDMYFRMPATAAPTMMFLPSTSPVCQAELDQQVARAMNDFNMNQPISIDFYPAPEKFEFLPSFQDVLPINNNVFDDYSHLVPTENYTNISSNSSSSSSLLGYSSQENNDGYDEYEYNNNCNFH